MASKMKMALVKTNRANMPEINAYYKYFSTRFSVSICTEDDALSTYDIVWYFMGRKGYRFHNEQFIIHDFASLSTPPFAKVKNLIKKMTLSKPDLRVFLNDSIKREMKFNDCIPFCYRDMGVDRELFIPQQVFDFDIVYVGAIAGRNLDKALDLLLSYNLGCTITIAGKADAEFVNKYQGMPVKFLGQVSYAEVASIVSRSKLCLNWIPDVYPYNIQTSTKFLEYISAGRAVISNSYAWVNEYAKVNNIKYININDREDILSNLNSPKVDLKGFKPYSWSDVISSSGIEMHISDFFKR
ncbi:TPA: glycosyltransferase [Kluyvera georgiana]|nr:glycosyltransferase [Kluyvera georgiana]